MLTNELDQKHTFVVDITRHKPLADTLNLISSVGEYVRLKFNTARMTWFIRFDQKAYLDGDIVVDNDSGLIIPKGEKIRNLINQLSQDGSSGHIFHVLSYDRSVLTDASDLNGTSFVVTTGYLDNIHKTSSEGSKMNFATSVDASTANGFEFASKFKPICS